jgi:PKHD-type hydroxylase
LSQIHTIAQVLNSEQLGRCRALLSDAPWGEGKVSAGTQAVQVKNNRQLPEDHVLGSPLRAIVLEALSHNGQFFTAALPRRIYPPLFNCYAGAQNSFGDHVDNAIRTHPHSAQHVRTDLSFTLFLSDPNDYEGGELIIEHGIASSGIKLPAGDLILYPSYSLHRVEPVTRGRRLACVSWVESMVREAAQRELLYSLDVAILKLREQQGDVGPVVDLTSCYHNLLRMWATV